MAWLDTAEHYYDRQLWDLLNVTFSATNNSPPPIAGAKGSHSFGSREDCLIARNFNCDLNTSTYIHRCVEERDQRGTPKLLSSFVRVSLGTEAESDSLVIPSRF